MSAEPSQSHVVEHSSSLPFLRAWLLVALVILLLPLGCVADRDPLSVDPGVIRFAPERTQVEVTIHNASPLARPLDDFRLSGSDWDALRFADETLPRMVEGRGTVTLHLAIAARAFVVEGGHRSGSAMLEFDSEGHTTSVPIAFEAPTTWERFGASSLAITLALAAIGLVVVRARRRTQDAVSRSSGWLGAALAITCSLGFLATIPLGPGWCSGRLAANVGANELAQCRAGLGGAPLLGFVGDPAWLWWWVLWIGATVGSVIVLLGRRAAEPSAARVGLVLVRAFGLLIVLACVTASLGASDPTGLLLVQSETFEPFGVPLPRWGLLAQPLAFVLALLLVADAGPSADEVTPLLAWLDMLIGSSFIAAVFLGGASVPVLGSMISSPLSHGANLALSALILVAKIALVAWAAQWLRARPIMNLQSSVAHSAKSGDSHAAARLRWHVHVGAPLALADLVATWLWQWFA